jgi:peptide/nickel transport system permease protein
MQFLRRFAPLARQRLWQGALTLAAVIIFNFVLVHLAPGSPVDVLAGEAGTSDPARAAALIKEFGLDKSLPSQFLDYVSNLGRLNLGYSYRDSQPVLDLILTRLPATLLLMTCAIVLSLAAGILIGVTAAWRVNTPIDQASSFLATLCYATPMFWSGLMLITIFSVKLGWLPSDGMRTVTFDEQNAFALVLDVARHLVLPTTSLALFYIAIYSRIMRASMLEVSRLDFIRAARARGLSSTAVYYRHALRNALLPVTTMAGVQIASMLGGSVIVETTYGWPGLGRLSFEAVTRRDYNLMMAILLISAVIVIVVNLLMDVLYCLIDPRIKHGTEEGR